VNVSSFPVGEAFPVEQGDPAFGVGLLGDGGGSVLSDEEGGGGEGGSPEGEG